jgi:hypothetical protein
LTSFAFNGVALETTAAILLFMAVFIFGDRVQPLHIFVRDRRAVISFAAGVSAAYVFVHVMPEVAEARDTFVHSTSLRLQYEGKEIYLVALLGFLVFYGLGWLRGRVKEAPYAQERLDFRLHIGGYAAYVWLVSYLLVDNLEETPASTAFYAVAMTLHFLTVDNALREEHREVYRRGGRFLLAGMCALGWLTGSVVDLPHDLLALMMAFLSGAVIMNSTIMELPSNADGRFIPFMAGGLLYALLLLPLA